MARLLAFNHNTTYLLKPQVDGVVVLVCHDSLYARIQLALYAMMHDATAFSFFSLLPLRIK